MKPEEFVARYSSIHDHKLSKIGAPLQRLGVTNFWRLAINEKGDVAFLGRNPEITEYFYGEKIFIGHSFFRHPDNIQPGLILESTDEEFLLSQLPMYRGTGLHQVAQFLERKDGAVYGVGFGTVIPNINLSHFYLNQQVFLRKFIQYFEHETERAWQMACDNRFNILDYVGTAFYTQSEKKNYKLPKLPGASTELSPRENECVDGLVRGYSARQIGERMGGLSQRTIESYLESVKAKWNCHSRQEIIAQALWDMGIID